MKLRIWSRDKKIKLRESEANLKLTATTFMREILKDIKIVVGGGRQKNNEE